MKIFNVTTDIKVTYVNQVQAETVAEAKTLAEMLAEDAYVNGDRIEDFDSQVTHVS